MRTAILAAGLAMIQLADASPSSAGMTQDLATCANAGGTAAVRACSRIIESGRLRSSHYYIAYYNRGWANRNSGNLDAASNDFSKSLQRNSKFADTYYSRAVVRFEKSDPDGARHDLASYIKLKDGDATASYKRALMLRWLGDIDEAIADLERAEKIKPSTPAFRYLKALLLSDKGENDAALELIGRKAGEDCGKPQECYARSIILYRTDLLDEALADLDRAVEKQEVFAAAHDMRARVLEKMGRRSEAVKSYEKALSLTVKSAEELLAQKDARERLAELKANERIPVAESESLTCRRFIPVSNSTISVACDR
ncbi:MAG: tetratricopeptide repeat protein [Alphaproteobacteria bacterium]|nr:tetratricopeptide repeat protein [Alphaproteobacteria bacterium]